MREHSVWTSRRWGDVATAWATLFAVLHLYWALGGAWGLAESAGPRLAADRPGWFVALGLYGEQDGRLVRTGARFTSEEHLRRVIDRIVSRVGRRVDESSPLVDARLADGSRVNAIIPPLAFSGSTLTIRKFAKDPFTVDDLLGFGTLSPEMAELLRACVEARLNVIVSGGTGTGKTTLDI